MENLTLEQQFELRSKALTDVNKLVALGEPPETIKINYMGKDYNLAVFKDRNGNWDVGLHNLVIR